LGRIPKSIGKYKSPGQYRKECWKCSKVGHYKKHFISKNVDKSKGYDDAPSTKMKTFMDERGDVYLASTSKVKIQIMMCGWLTWVLHFI
jgi:hypothetical protein